MALVSYVVFGISLIGILSYIYLIVNVVTLYQKHPGHIYAYTLYYRIL